MQYCWQHKLYGNRGINLLKNKNFWEELVAFFPIDMIKYSIRQIKRKSQHLCVMKSMKQYNLRGCSVGSTDGVHLWNIPLKLYQMAWYVQDVSWELSWQSSNINTTIATVWETVVLVLLMGAIYDICRRYGL
jgi:hypothetical protein